MSYYVSVGKNYFRAVIDAIDGLDKAKKALGSAKDVFWAASKSVMCSSSFSYTDAAAVVAVGETLEAALAEVMARGANKEEAKSQSRKVGRSDIAPQAAHSSNLGPQRRDRGPLPGFVPAESETDGNVGRIRGYTLWCGDGPSGQGQTARPVPGV